MVLVLEPPNFPPLKLILEETGMMGSSGHIIVITQYPPWRHGELGVFQLILIMILHLVLHLDMVKVVWVLVPTTFPPRKLIY